MCVLALAGIRRLVVNIKAIQKDVLIPPGGFLGCVRERGDARNPPGCLAPNQKTNGSNKTHVIIPRRAARGYQWRKISGFCPRGALRDPRGCLGVAERPRLIQETLSNSLCHNYFDSTDRQTAPITHKRLQGIPPRGAVRRYRRARISGVCKARSCVRPTRVFLPCPPGLPLAGPARARICQRISSVDNSAEFCRYERFQGKGPHLKTL